MGNGGLKMKRLSVLLSFVFLLSSIAVCAIIPTGYFVKNEGQWSKNILFASFNNNCNFLVTDNGFIFDYYHIKQNEDKTIKISNVIAYKIENGNFNNFVEEETSEWYLNFFISNNPSYWKKFVRGSRKVIIKDLLPKIDAVLSYSDNLRYDFIVHPGGNPELIRFTIEGAKAEIVNSKAIKIHTTFGEVKHNNLFVYQKIEGKISKIPANFKKIDDNVFGFDIKSYDQNHDLIIDPTVFSCLIGGSNTEEIVDIIEPEPGNIIVTGWTESFDFPTTAGAYSRDFSGQKDIFISSFCVKGSKRNLIFSTFLGGSETDYPANVMIDSKNNIIIGGTTNSLDLPLVNSISKSALGQYDAYVCKFNSRCDSIIYSTYLGGNKDDIATAFKLAEDNSIYSTGYTNSTNLPVTGGALQSALKGKNDAFFLKLSNTGQTILICTYIGGVEDDFAYCMDVSPSEYVYIGGATKSNDFPAFPVRIWGNPPYEYVMETPFDRSYNGNFDGFVIKLFGNGGGIEYISFFGGLADDFVTTISYYSPDEKLVFAGKTFKEPSAVTFPLTQNAYQNTIKGMAETFVASLSNIRVTQQYGYNYKSQDLVFSTFIGGSQDDIPTKIIFNPTTQTFFIGGYTNSTNFPIVNNPSGKKFQKNDIYLVSLSVDGSSVVFSDIYGGNNDDYLTSILLTSDGDFYLTGKTFSSNFPVINPIDNLTTGNLPNAFILKNVGTSLNLDSPIGNEEYCPDSKIPVKWSSSGLKSTDTFSIEIKTEDSDNWILIDSNVIGFSKYINIPENIFGKVYIRVSHRRGLITTSQFPINILKPPVIKKVYPENTSIEVCEGDSITFYAAAEGSKLKYQWMFNNQKIQNATDTFLVLNNLKPENSGIYKLVVTGFCPPNAESNEFLLGVIFKTKVVASSSDTTVKIGEMLNLFVDAIGKDIKYQWYKDYSKLLGETNSTFTIPKVSKDDKGQYFCILEGICGKDTTPIINVSIDTVISSSPYIESCPYKSKYIIANDKLLVELPIIELANSIFVSIFDVLGNQVEFKEIFPSTKEHIEIGISQLPSGSYFAVIGSSGFSYRIFFIKF